MDAKLDLRPTEAFSLSPANARNDEVRLRAQRNN
jgi:hypothetical protein